MHTQSRSSTVTFPRPFHLSGRKGDLPAGDYEILVESEILHGLGFEARRRTATYLTLRGRGRTELLSISAQDLERALGPAQAAEDIDPSDAALSPREDLK